MPLTVQSFDELDADAVEQSLETQSQLLVERHPEIYRLGVNRELLLYVAAIFATKNRTELDRYRQASTLKAIAENPELADPELVEYAASNVRLTRLPGGHARGRVTVVVSELVSTAIEQGAVFEAEGQQFVTEAPFTGRVSLATIQSDTDRLLTPVGDGTYAFTIEVVAVEPGVAGQLSQRTQLTPLNPPLRFVQAVAAEDFVGGFNEETNQALVARALEGLTCQAISGRQHMQAALRGQPAFENVLAASFLGAGDEGMTRDQNTIWPGSLGGKVDCYVRTAERLQRVKLTKTATLVDPLQGIWQIGLGRDECPGFYDVYSIVPAGSLAAGSYPVTSELRGLDTSELPSGALVPDMPDVVHGMYTRFQTAIVRFHDTDTDASELPPGSTAQYDITVRGIPLLAELQDYVGGWQYRNLAGDALAKAPIPCFVSISATIELRPGQAPPNVDVIKHNLAELVNRYGFTGRLPGSAVLDVIHNSLTGVAHVDGLQLVGMLRRPDGTSRLLQSSETLILPEEPDKMITARTVGFYVDVDDIALSVTVADIPEV